MKTNFAGLYTLSEDFYSENSQSQKTTLNPFEWFLKKPDSLTMKGVARQYFNLHPKGPTFFFQASCHPSFLHEHSSPSLNQNLKSYEVLEFLGDSVYQLFITSTLLERYPDQTEGEYSKMRGHFSNKIFLSQVAASIELEKVILLSKGLLSHSKISPTILGDVFESLLGAIFLECRQDFLKFSQHLKYFEQQYFLKTGQPFLSFSQQALFDAKTQLQELCWQKFKTLPEYTYETSSKNFCVSVSIKDRLLAQGKGISKKETEKKVAQQALIYLQEKKDL